MQFYVKRMGTLSREGVTFSNVLASRPKEKSTIKVKNASIGSKILLFRLDQFQKEVVVHESKQEVTIIVSPVKSFRKHAYSNI